jgi:carboxymethylenebutenolidase
MDEIHQYLVDEWLDHYREGSISRRDFMRRAVLLGAGAATATAMAASVVPARRARAAPTAQNVSPFHVEENDPRVATDWIWYRSTDGVELKAYLAWPTDAAMNRSQPGALVCHMNRGLDSYARDVARRFAVQGYVGVAPDLPSRTGTPTDEFPDTASLMAAYRQLTLEQSAFDFAAAGDFLRAHPAVDENKLAATGYCFGGGIIWRLAAIYPALTAAAPFYGGNPPLDQVPNIRAAMLGVYGELDTNTNAGIPALTAAMDEAGTRYQVNIYPNSTHAFHDDIDPGTRYNPVTAPQAWMDTLNWFATYLELQPPMTA